MRSWTRPFGALLAALALSACGNYSTEDLRFLAALPQRDDLAFKVPSPPSGALSACPPANASVWLQAKPTADGINAGVEFLLALVDAVRREPPTWRAEDARGWGPFDAENRPGREIQVLIARTYPSELAGAPRYVYLFQARWKGAPEFTNVIAGAFDGGSASRGSGWLVLDFDAMIALGMDDEGTPSGNMQVAYDRASDPATIQLALSAGGFGVVNFGYRSARYAAGGGLFDFAIRDPAGNVLYILTGYDAQGAGRADVGVQLAGGGTGGFRQCWGANACLVYVLDPLNLSCDPPDEPCSYGVEADCPAVPASPF